MIDMGFWSYFGISLVVAFALFIFMIWYKSKQRMKMFDMVNSYLLTFKLNKPAYLYNHKIEYSINDGQHVTSLKPFLLEDIRTNTGHYYVNLRMEYFAYHGLTIKLNDQAQSDKKKDRYLSIEIIDSSMNDIMNDEFKQVVQAMFGPRVYTSNDFNSTNMDYNAHICGSYKKLAKSFVKLNLAVEKLASSK